MVRHNLENQMNNEHSQPQNKIHMIRCGCKTRSQVFEAVFLKKPRQTGGILKIAEKVLYLMNE
jgi:hypothetical protein